MKTTSKLLIVILCFVLFSACRNNYKSLNAPDRSEEELEELIYKHGDVDAYNELLIAYCDKRVETFIPFSFIMAHTYDYPTAYFDVAHLLMVIYRDRKDKMTDSVAHIILEYMQTAYLKGEEQAKECMEESGISDTDTDKEKVLKIYNKFW